MLNCYADDYPETNGINPGKVRLLKEIQARTNAIIVLSSSWKLGYNKKTGEKRNFYKILENCLRDYNLEIYDITDNLPCGSKIICTEPLSFEQLISIPLDYGDGRGEEITRWLMDHDVESFVILDDENWEYNQYGFMPYFIQSNYYEKDGGLQREHVERAVRILNRKKK